MCLLSPQEFSAPEVLVDPIREATGCDDPLSHSVRSFHEAYLMVGLLLEEQIERGSRQAIAGRRLRKFRTLELRAAGLRDDLDCHS